MSDRREVSPVSDFSGPIQSALKAGRAASPLEDIVVSEVTGNGLAALLHESERHASSLPERRNVLKRTIGSIKTALDRLNPPPGIPHSYTDSGEIFPNGGLGGMVTPQLQKPKPPQAQEK